MNISATTQTEGRYAMGRARPDKVVDWTLSPIVSLVVEPIVGLFTGLVIGLFASRAGNPGVVLVFSLGIGLLTLPLLGPLGGLGYVLGFGLSYGAKRLFFS